MYFIKLMPANFHLVTFHSASLFQGSNGFFSSFSQPNYDIEKNILKEISTHAWSHYLWVINGLFVILPIRKGVARGGAWLIVN